MCLLYIIFWKYKNLSILKGKPLKKTPFKVKNPSQQKESLSVHVWRDLTYQGTCFKRATIATVRHSAKICFIQCSPCNKFT